MVINNNSFVTLDALATILSLPRGYLKRFAEEKLIPSLNVNGRLRFNVSDVQAALSNIAARKIAAELKEGSNE